MARWRMPSASDGKSRVKALFKTWVKSDAALRLNTTRPVSLLPLALTLALIGINLLSPSRVWIVLLWAVGGLTALAYYWIREMAGGMSFRHQLRAGWVQVGDRLEQRFELSNRSWLPVLWAEVGDGSDLPGYKAGRVVSCEGMSTVRWTASAECTRRGVFTLGPWSLRAQDPFGFFSVVLRHDETEAIVIHPPVVHLPEIVLPQGLVAGPSRARWRAAEPTVEAGQTRAYRPGDPLRQIHWPSTAHQGELIVRDPDAQISGDLWIVLDMDRAVQAGEGAESTEEYAVILAASLADRTLRQNRAVGLVAFGDGLAMLPLGRGKAQVWRILQALATVRAGGSRRLADVLGSVEPSLKQGTTVLVITPSCATDWPPVLLPLARRGVAPAVVLLDPESFDPAGSLQGVAGKLREFLADAGISAHVIPQGYPFRYVVPPRRRGHWEFKVTPLGRAIAVRRPEDA